MTTRPYAWPYDGPPADAAQRCGHTVGGQRLALVVVGAQAWALSRTNAPEQALATLQRVAGAVRDSGGVVMVVTRRGHGEVSFATDPADTMLEAAGTNAFFGSALDRTLRAAGRDRLVIGGLGLETAVYSTIGAANDRGYECLVLADASAPHDPEVGVRALASVTMSGGIFGAVGTSDDLYAHLGRHTSCVP